LLDAPTPESRRHLLTMPCNVERLLRLRFRTYDEDVARDALVTWLDPSRSAEEVRASYGNAPRDARLWLTTWPYLYLARNAVRRLHRHGERIELSGGSESAIEPVEQDPTAALRVTRALERVRRVDPVGYAMLLDFLHDRFDARGWGRSLGASDATVTDRKYISIYRYAVYFHDVMERIAPHDAAVALSARRFAPLDGLTTSGPAAATEAGALDSARSALADPSLTMSRFRQLYRDGARQSLTLLADPDALGQETMAAMGTSFRRILRID
jgi:hypothetical protein